jgi:hypothetical protein
MLVLLAHYTPFGKYVGAMTFVKMTIDRETFKPQRYFCRLTMYKIVHKLLCSILQSAVIFSFIIKCHSVKCHCAKCHSDNCHPVQNL